jgi:predicted transposase YbfD/YdcC
MQPATNLIDNQFLELDSIELSEIEQKSFYEALQMNLPDTRGKQGLRHYLPFVVFCTILGILHKKSNKASIQRFMSNKLDLLCKLTEHKAEKAVSAPQLGRIMSSLDWQSVNVISEEHLGFRINCTNSKEGFWLSGDGKDLRGGVEVNSTNTSSTRGEVSIRLIEHDSKRVIAQDFYDGDKESEKIHIRNLIKDNGLCHHSITLDAIHCDPKTTAMIARSGVYLIRVKENQEYLIKDLLSEARREREDKRFISMTTHDKGHGRIERREYTLFDVSKQTFDSRWQTSHISTMISVNRQRETMSKGKVTKIQQDTAYFISNKYDKDLKMETLMELSNAVRGHWSIETDNHIRDVTLGEDKVKTQKGNRTRAEATIRTIALEWLKLENPKNYMAILEKFADSEAFLIDFLIKHRFIKRNFT